MHLIRVKSHQSQLRKVPKRFTYMSLKSYGQRTADFDKNAKILDSRRKSSFFGKSKLLTKM